MSETVEDVRPRRTGKLRRFRKWEDLPYDLKVYCIDKMDIITRLNLRGASKFEKKLVESTFQVYKMKVVKDRTDDPFTLYLKMSPTHQRERFHTYNPYFVSALLRISIFEDLQWDIKREKYAELLMTVILYNVELRYRSVYFGKQTSWIIPVMVLQKTWDQKIKRIVMRNMGSVTDELRMYSSEVFADLPAVLRTKLIKISGLQQVGLISNLLLKLMARDVPVGTTLDVSLALEIQATDEIAKIKNNRHISRSERGIHRLRPGNIHKEYVLGHVCFTARSEPLRESVYCTSIWAGLPDEEFKKVESRILETMTKMEPRKKLCPLRKLHGEELDEDIFF